MIKTGAAVARDYPGPVELPGSLVGLHVHGNGLLCSSGLQSDQAVVGDVGIAGDLGSFGSGGVAGMLGACAGVVRLGGEADVRDYPLVACVHGATCTTEARTID